MLLQRVKELKDDSELADSLKKVLPTSGDALAVAEPGPMESNRKPLNARRIQSDVHSGAPQNGFNCMELERIHPSMTSHWRAQFQRTS
jgi:hypothetical protein